MVKLQRLGSPPYRCSSFGVGGLVYEGESYSCFSHGASFLTSFTILFSRSVALIVVSFSIYLCRDLLSDRLTVSHWDRLLIVIISHCRGVASLGIFSVYVLIGQVDGNRGRGWR